MQIKSVCGVELKGAGEGEGGCASSTGSEAVIEQ